MITHAIHTLTKELMNPSMAIYESVNEDFIANPSKYERVKFPPQWQRKGIELANHPDVLMHLVFLGLVKQMMLLIQEWLTCKNKNAWFITNCGK